MRIRNLLSAALVAGAALASTSTPAGALHADVCVAQGIAWTTPLWYPGGPNGGGGYFSLTTPSDATICTYGSVIDAHGSFGPLAYCGHSTATGQVNGHDFTYVSAGSVLVIAGSPVQGNATLVGVATATPDATRGQSCMPTNPEGATMFIVTGAIAFIA